MTEQQHPITPPPDLLQQWAADYWDNPREAIAEGEKYIAIQAARWGADQELEACCEWVANTCPLGTAKNLYYARRPKPPTLAEQALAQTNAILTDPSRVLLIEVRETLELNRRALERLQELETRAAELLQRQILVPEVVSERPWEREGWCDELGRCWWGRPDTGDWSADWTLATPEAIAEFCEFSPQTVCLPAHALPLPEVDNG